MLCKVRMHLALNKPHQLSWGDWEMGTATYLMYKMKSDGWPYLYDW